MPWIRSKKQQNEEKETLESILRTESLRFHNRTHDRSHRNRRCAVVASLVAIALLGCGAAVFFLFPRALSVQPSVILQPPFVVSQTSASATSTGSITANTTLAGSAAYIVGNPNWIPVTMSGVSVVVTYLPRTPAAQSTNAASPLPVLAQGSLAASDTSLDSRSASNDFSIPFTHIVTDIAAADGLLLDAVCEGTCNLQLTLQGSYDYFTQTLQISDTQVLSVPCSPVTLPGIDWAAKCRLRK